MTPHATAPGEGGHGQTGSRNGHEHLAHDTTLARLGRLGSVRVRGTGEMMSHMMTTHLRRLLYGLRARASSPNRNARTATVLGRLLGLAFVICLLTGLYSHFLQEPAAWMSFPTQPVWLYQLTQGIHITAGIACIPLLLGKLYAVFPQLFQSPPIKHPIDVLERASIALFVAASILQIVTGLLNTYQYYPWPFPFKQVHFALSFVIIGSLAIHIGVKLPMITRYWRARDSYDADGRFIEPHGASSTRLAPRSRPARVAPRERAARTMRRPTPTGPSTRSADSARPPPPPTAGGAAPGRVGRSCWIDSAHEIDRSRPAHRRVAPRLLHRRRRRHGRRRRADGRAVVRPARRRSTPFAPRQHGLGPNDLPINRTAAAAQVLETAMDPDWRLTSWSTASATRTFSLDDAARA